MAQSSGSACSFYYVNDIFHQFWLCQKQWLEEEKEISFVIIYLKLQSSRDTEWSTTLSKWALLILSLILINLQGFPSPAAQNYHRKALHRNCKYLEAPRSILPQSESFSAHSLSGVRGKPKSPNIFPAFLNTH